MTDQYKCPSYYDDDNILRDCTCGKCGETTPQDWREEAVDEIVDEHPWIYRLEEALVNEDKYHYCEVDATDLKFTIKHYRRLQNLLSSRDTYWKERVRKEVEGMRKKSSCGCPPFQPQHDGYCWNEEFPGESRAYNQALDTLLDNLK